MALIQCLECGRENVSDSAEACPNCGFNLKNYTLQQRMVQKRYRDDELRQQHYQDVEDSIPFPNKPKYKVSVIIIGCFLILGAVLGIYNKQEWWISTAMICLAIITFYAGFNEFRQEKEEYELAKTDFGAYAKMKAKKIISEELDAEVERRKKQASSAECPYCKSRNTTKITATGRIVSGSLLGPASSKIRNQWHCNNCGSDF